MQLIAEDWEKIISTINEVRSQLRSDFAQERKLRSKEAIAYLKRGKHEIHTKAVGENE